jgi:RimK family alpha-L-glutamate ligase
MRLFWYENPNYCTERALAAAARLGIEVITAGPEQVAFLSAPPYLLANGQDVLASCDAVLIRKFAPYVSEALTIARLFASAGKKVFDPTLVDEGYVISKMHDTLLLRTAGLPVPHTEQHYGKPDTLAVAQRMGYPVILKGVHGTGGHRVHKADTPEQAQEILAQYPEWAITVQEFLPAETDWRVIVIGGQALPLAVERTPQAGDFRTNTDFSNDLKAVPRTQNPVLFDLAEQAAKVLRRTFTGVDLRLQNGQPCILEVNRRPGFRAFEPATGLDVAGTALTMIKNACA